MSRIENVKNNITAPTETGLSLTACITILYLTLPVFVFLLGWVTMPAGLLLSFLLLFLLFKLYQIYASPTLWTWPFSPLTRKQLLLSAGLAITWVFLGGIGHYLFINSDWTIRDAVFRDLMLSDWPISYGMSDTGITFLRVPLGYYLIPSLIGKLFNSTTALNIAVFLFTALGVFLFFMLVTADIKKLRHATYIILIFIFFGGMKIFAILMKEKLAWGLTFPNVWPIYMHNWAAIAHYSASTTELYWSPNHAIPGWLLAGLWWRYRSNPRLLQAGVFAAPVALLWSPFAAIGILPMLVDSLIQHRKALLSNSAYFIFFGVLLVMLPIGLYLSIDSGQVPREWLISIFLHKPVLFYLHFIAFVVFEFGLLVFFLYKVTPQPLVLIIGVTLLLLPLYRYGAYSDMAQQAAVASLAVLPLLIAQSLIKDGKKFWTGYGSTVMVILLIGAATAALEMYPNIKNPRWEFSTRCSVTDAWHELKINLPTATYIATTDGTPLVLQMPHLVAPRPEDGKPCWPERYLQRDYFPF